MLKPPAAAPLFTEAFKERLPSPEQGTQPPAGAHRKLRRRPQARPSQEPGRERRAPSLVRTDTHLVTSRAMTHLFHLQLRPIKWCISDTRESTGGKVFGPHYPGHSLLPASLQDPHSPPHHTLGDKHECVRKSQKVPPLLSETPLYLMCQGPLSQERRMPGAPWCLSCVCTSTWQRVALRGCSESVCCRIGERWELSTAQQPGKHKVKGQRLKRYLQAGSPNTWPITNTRQIGRPALTRLRDSPFWIHLFGQPNAVFALCRASWLPENLFSCKRWCLPEDKVKTVKLLFSLHSLSLPHSSPLPPPSPSLISTSTYPLYLSSPSPIFTSISNLHLLPSPPSLISTSISHLHLSSSPPSVISTSISISSPSLFLTFISHLTSISHIHLQFSYLPPSLIFAFNFCPKTLISPRSTFSSFQDLLFLSAHSASPKSQVTLSPHRLPFNIPDLFWGHLAPGPSFSGVVCFLPIPLS